MTSHHHHRRDGSPSKRYSTPARSSTNSISTSSYDPYYDTYRRGSKDDYVIKTSRAGSSSKPSGLVPISTETYVTYPSSSTRSPVVDSFPSRPRRSTLTGADRPQSGLRTAATSVAQERAIARPSSPLSRTRDVEMYSKPHSSITRSSHKKVYSIDDSGETRLISESGSAPQYVLEDEVRRDRHKHRSQRKEIEDSEFSYTDPAGMFRDTEPSWRPRERERRGSIDRGTSARPNGYIDTADLYGPPPRASTTRLDGPPPSTRGFDQINSGLARNRSLREPARTSSRDRYRSDTYDAYGSDDDYYYRRNYGSRQERATPLAHRDHETRDYEPRRQRIERDPYDDAFYQSDPRRASRDDYNSHRFKDAEVETRGFGIRRRSPSKDRYGVSSNESLEDRRMSNIPLIPAGYTASSQDLPSVPDAHQYSGARESRDDRHYSRDDRYHPAELPRASERIAGRDEHGYDLPPPPRRDDRRPSPDTRQNQEFPRNDDDRTLKRDDKDWLPPPPPISDRHPSPQRRKIDDDYDADYTRDRDHRNERTNDRRGGDDEEEEHNHRGAAAAVAGAAALGAGALGVEEHRKREKRREEDERRDTKLPEESRRRDPEPRSKEDLRDEPWDHRNERRDEARSSRREDRRDDFREERADNTRDVERDDRDARRPEHNTQAPRKIPSATEVDASTDAPDQLDPDEEYRRRVAEAQRELYGDAPRGSTGGAHGSERERRRLRHDDRKIGRDVAAAGVVGAAGVGAYEVYKGEDDPLRDRKDHSDDRERSRQTSSYDPRYLPPPPPGGPPGPGPRTSNGSLHSNQSITDRQFTAEPADMRQDENRGMPGGYPHDPRPPYPSSDAPPGQSSGDIAITDAMSLVPAGKTYHGQGSSDEYSGSERERERKETRVRIVEPARHDSQSPPATAPKGILRKPTEKFPEHPNPIREGVAPLKDPRVAKVMKERGIPAGAKWTKIDRKLVNPQALVEAKERFEERLDCVIVLRVLTKEEIQALADKTREIREERESKYEREHGRNHESRSHHHRRRRHKDNKDDGKEDDSETDDTDLDDEADRSDKRRDERRDHDRDRERRDDEHRHDKDRDGDRDRERDRVRDRDTDAGRDRQR